MAERARITDFFAPLSTGEPGSFHLTDDAALLTPPAGKQLVVTTDSVIEGIHILAGSSPQHVAQKLMRRNLSDLAAMGATPWRYLLNLHTPRGLSDDWVRLFAYTLGEEQQQFGMVLAGGDSTSGDGPLHLTLTCLGLIEGAALRRNGATVGDYLYVSGTLGDAAIALSLLQHHLPCDPALAARYYTPTPRLALGHMLRNLATSAIDISDGLLADLAQLCTASQCGAEVLQRAIPLSHAAQHAALDAAAKMRLAMSGGDDYELLFTAAPDMRARIEGIAAALETPLTCIGRITPEKTIRVLDANGKPVALPSSGYEHA